jgi:deoxyribose-phosphate aldolase
MTESTRVAASRALSSLDLTNLDDDCTEANVDALCTRATGVFGSVAAVCIWPRFVPHAVDRLSASAVRIATVVNFPDGGEDARAAGELTCRAVDDGAQEIDVVLPYRAFLRGDMEAAGAVLDVTREACGDRTMKVIIESGEHPSLDSTRAAAAFAITHGADFVKTSTGKSPTSATLAAAVMILDAIRSGGRSVGLKVSGGVRTVEEAGAYLMLADQMMGPGWATPSTFRFGASRLLDSIENALRAG